MLGIVEETNPVEHLLEVPILLPMGKTAAEPAKEWYIQDGRCLGGSERTKLTSPQGYFREVCC